MARSLAVAAERLLKTNTCRDAVRAAWISCISATRFPSAVHPTTTIQNAEETIRNTAIGRIHRIGDNIYKTIATSNTTAHCHLPTSVRYATSGTYIIQICEHLSNRHWIFIHVFRFCRVRYTAATRIMLANIAVRVVKSLAFIKVTKAPLSLLMHRTRVVLIRKREKRHHQLASADTPTRIEQNTHTHIHNMLMIS